MWNCSRRRSCAQSINPEAAHAMGERGKLYVEKYRSWDLSAQTTDLFFQYMVREFNQPDSAEARG